MDNIILMYRFNDTTASFSVSIVWSIADGLEKNESLYKLSAVLSTNEIVIAQHLGKGMGGCFMAPSVVCRDAMSSRGFGDVLSND